MTLLTAIVPTAAGTVVPAAGAVSASDTIAQAAFGKNGVNLKIINAGAGVDTITISDNGATPAGNQLASNAYTVTVTNGTSKAFSISPLAVNPSTGVVTITHSQPAGVTYELYSEDD